MSIKKITTLGQRYKVELALVPTSKRPLLTTIGLTQRGGKSLSRSRFAERKLSELIAQLEDSALVANSLQHTASLDWLSLFPVASYTAPAVKKRLPNLVNLPHLASLAELGSVALTRKVELESLNLDLFKKSKWAYALGAYADEAISYPRPTFSLVLPVPHVPYRGYHIHSLPSEQTLSRLDLTNKVWAQQRDLAARTKWQVDFSGSSEVSLSQAETNADEYALHKIWFNTFYQEGFNSKLVHEYGQLHDLLLLFNKQREDLVIASYKNVEELTKPVTGVDAEGAAPQFTPQDIPVCSYPSLTASLLSSAKLSKTKNQVPALASASYVSSSYHDPLTTTGVLTGGVSPLVQAQVRSQGKALSLTGQGNEPLATEESSTFPVASQELSLPPAELQSESVDLFAGFYHSNWKPRGRTQLQQLAFQQGLVTAGGGKAALAELEATGFQQLEDGLNFAQKVNLEDTFDLAQDAFSARLERFKHWNNPWGSMIAQVHFLDNEVPTYSKYVSYPKELHGQTVEVNFNLFRQQVPQATASLPTPEPETPTDQVSADQARAAQTHQRQKLTQAVIATPAETKLALALEPQQVRLVQPFAQLAEAPVEAKQAKIKLDSQPSQRVLNTSQQPTSQDYYQEETLAEQKFAQSTKQGYGQERGQATAPQMRPSLQQTTADQMSPSHSEQTTAHESSLSQTPTKQTSCQTPTEQTSPTGLTTFAHNQVEQAMPGASLNDTPAASLELTACAPESTQTTSSLDASASVPPARQDDFSLNETINAEHAEAFARVSAKAAKVNGQVVPSLTGTDIPAQQAQEPTHTPAHASESLEPLPVGFAGHLTGEASLQSAGPLANARVEHGAGFSANAVGVDTLKGFSALAAPAVQANAAAQAGSTPQAVPTSQAVPTFQERLLDFGKYQQQFHPLVAEGAWLVQAFHHHGLLRRIATYTHQGLASSQHLIKRAKVDVEGKVILEAALQAKHLALQHHADITQTIVVAFADIFEQLERQQSQLVAQTKTIEFDPDASAKVGVSLSEFEIDDLLAYVQSQFAQQEQAAFAGTSAQAFATAPASTQKLEAKSADAALAQASQGSPELEALLASASQVDVLKASQLVVELAKMGISREQMQALARANGLQEVQLLNLALSLEVSPQQLAALASGNGLNALSELNPKQLTALAKVFGYDTVGGGLAAALAEHEQLQPQALELVDHITTLTAEQAASYLVPQPQVQVGLRQQADQELDQALTSLSAKLFSSDLGAEMSVQGYAQPYHFKDWLIVTSIYKHYLYLYQRGHDLRTSLMFEDAEVVEGIVSTIVAQMHSAYAQEASLREFASPVVGLRLASGAAQTTGQNTQQAVSGLALSEGINLESTADQPVSATETLANLSTLPDEPQAPSTQTPTTGLEAQGQMTSVEPKRQLKPVNDTLQEHAQVANELVSGLSVNYYTRASQETSQEPSQETSQKTNQETSQETSQTTAQQSHQALNPGKAGTSPQRFADDSEHKRIGALRQAIAKSLGWLVAKEAIEPKTEPKAEPADPAFTRAVPAPADAPTDGKGLLGKEVRLGQVRNHFVALAQQWQQAQAEPASAQAQTTGQSSAQAALLQADQSKQAGQAEPNASAHKFKFSSDLQFALQPKDLSVRALASRFSATTSTVAQASSAGLRAAVSIDSGKDAWAYEPLHKQANQLSQLESQFVDASGDFDWSGHGVDDLLSGYGLSGQAAVRAEASAAQGQQEKTPQEKSQTSQVAAANGSTIKAPTTNTPDIDTPDIDTPDIDAQVQSTGVPSLTLKGDVSKLATLAEPGSHPAILSSAAGGLETDAKPTQTSREFIPTHMSGIALVLSKPALAKSNITVDYYFDSVTGLPVRERKGGNVGEEPGSNWYSYKPPEEPSYAPEDLQRLLRRNPALYPIHFPNYSKQPRQGPAKFFSPQRTRRLVLGMNSLPSEQASGLDVNLTGQNQAGQNQAGQNQAGQSQAADNQGRQHQAQQNQARQHQAQQTQLQVSGFYAGEPLASGIKVDAFELAMWGQEVVDFTKLEQMWEKMGDALWTLMYCEQASWTAKLPNLEFTIYALFSDIAARMPLGLAQLLDGKDVVSALAQTPGQSLDLFATQEASQVAAYGSDPEFDAIDVTNLNLTERAREYNRWLAFEAAKKPQREVAAQTQRKSAIALTAHLTAPAMAVVDLVEQVSHAFFINFPWRLSAKGQLAIEQAQQRQRQQQLLEEAVGLKIVVHQAGAGLAHGRQHDWVFAQVAPELQDQLEFFRHELWYLEATQAQLQAQGLDLAYDGHYLISQPWALAGFHAGSQAIDLQGLVDKVRTLFAQPSYLQALKSLTVADNPELVAKLGRWLPTLAELEGFEFVDETVNGIYQQWLEFLHALNSVLQARYLARIVEYLEADFGRIVGPGLVFDVESPVAVIGPYAGQSLAVIGTPIPSPLATNTLTYPVYPLDLEIYKSLQGWHIPVLTFLRESTYLDDCGVKHLTPNAPEVREFAAKAAA